MEDVAFPSAIEKALHHAFLQTDAAFAEACSANRDLDSGTTAIVVLVLGRLDLFLTSLNCNPRDMHGYMFVCSVSMSVMFMYMCIYMLSAS